MRFSSMSSEGLEIFSPSDVLIQRQNRLSENYKRLRPEKPSVEISAKVSNLVQTFGLSLYDSMIGMCYSLTHRLFSDYNFKYGTEIVFSGVIPNWLSNNHDDETFLLLMEYTLGFLTAIGWVVTWEDKSDYVLKFHPLQCLTPEEVDVEKQNIVNKFASEIISKINELLPHNKTTFTAAEIAMDKIPSELYDLIISRVRDHLSPYWQMTIFSRNNILIIEK